MLNSDQCKKLKYMHEAGVVKAPSQIALHAMLPSKEFAYCATKH